LRSFAGTLISNICRPGLLAGAAVIYEANPEIVQEIQNWISGVAQYGLP
jgi:hypothetical protein